MGRASLCGQIRYELPVYPYPPEHIVLLCPLCLPRLPDPLSITHLHSSLASCQPLSSSSCFSSPPRHLTSHDKIRHLFSTTIILNLSYVAVDSPSFSTSDRPSFVSWKTHFHSRSLSPIVRFHIHHGRHFRGGIRGKYLRRITTTLNIKEEINPSPYETIIFGI